MAEVTRPKWSSGNGLRSETITARSLTILAVLAVVAALYFGKAVFLPLALAILLTFVLAPPVRKLRGWGAGRVPSVVIVVVLAFSIIGGIGTLLGQQITDLASTLPQYQTTIRDKIQSLRETAGSSGLLSRMASFVSNLNQEISRKSDGPQNERPRQDNSQPAPVPVEIHQAPPTPMEVIQRIIQPLLDPLVTTGVVVIFVIFFLLQREDLRDRLIRLAGSHDLQRTTEAIDDGAQRLSRYFLAQLALNMLFGVIVGTGLALIGVPNPLLFGIMAAILRFVPYIGGFLSGTFPVALAIAVDPGWSMALITIGFFLVVEPLIGQVIEPLVYGHSTGLSPVAVILAATFWTWLWGPVGLLLSTPLTVCLSVLGRHIEWLNFLDVLIGDDPPLTPPQAFYQRALAGDIDEMLEQAEQMLKRMSLSAYYDRVVLQGLTLAQIDVRRGTLGDEQVEQINEAVHTLLAELADYDDVAPGPRGEKDARRDPESDIAPAPDLPKLSPDEVAAGWRGEHPLLCVAGQGPFDAAAGVMLVQLLGKHGIRAQLEADRAISATRIVRLNPADIMMVCLSYLEVMPSAAHLRYAMRRIRRRVPNTKILIGLWGNERPDVVARELTPGIVADEYANSLRQALAVCIDAACVDLMDERQPPDPGPSLPKPSAA